MWLGGQRQSLATLLPGNMSGTHCTGGWMGPRAELDSCLKSRNRHHQYSIPGPCSPQHAAIPTEISRSTSHWVWTLNPTNVLDEKLLVISLYVWYVHGKQETTFTGKFYWSDHKPKQADEPGGWNSVFYKLSHSVCYLIYYTYSV
jgi:hypothetical protein